MAGDRVKADGRMCDVDREKESAKQRAGRIARKRERERETFIQVQGGEDP